MADKNGNGVTGDIPIATVRSELLAIIRKKTRKQQKTDLSLEKN
jgi:hypothetical protein